MSNIYSWKGRKQGDPQLVGEALEKIRVKSGKLKPAAVVRAAKRESSVLHRYFTWDDGVAGEKYRESEARHLMRVIMIAAPTPENPIAKVRSFVNVKIQTASKVEQYYQSAEVAVKNVDEFSVVIAELKRKAAGLEMTISELKQLAARRGQKDVALVALAAEALVAFEKTLDCIN